MSSFSYSALNFTYDKKTQIITPNQRLSRYLHKQEKLRQFSKKNSATAFYEQKISSFESWLEEQFELLKTLYPLKYSNIELLSAQHEKQLWQEVILHSELSADLIFPENCLQSLSQAYGLLQAWLLNLKTIENSHYFLGLDQTCFLSWHNDFENLCIKKQVIPKQKLSELIYDAIKKSLLRLDRNYIFYGFDELTPRQKLMQECILLAGSSIQNIELPETSVKYQRLLKCKDSGQELNLASEWAKTISEANPDAQIAIVVPSLASYRQTVFNTFLKTLSPEKLKPNSSIYPLSFNISSGIILTDVPLIKAALLCIDIQKLLVLNEKIDCQTLISIFQSPFLLSTSLTQKEKFKISQALQNRKKHEIDKIQLLNILKKSNINTESLENITRRLSQVIDNKLTQTHLQWQSYFLKHLDDYQWLHGRILDSESFQASKKLIALLNQFSQMDNHFDECTLKQAIYRLQDLVRNELFQADSLKEDQNNIHILGTLEAAGQDFSHLWVCEMHDKSWPPKPNPNPFLPSGLQKELFMPHSSAQRELDFCHKMTRRFQQHSQYLIFSYSETDKDEILRPSPLLKEIELLTQEQLVQEFNLNPSDSLHSLIFNVKKIDYFSDSKKLPINQSDKPKGGQSIIKNQAQCPFSAFAAHRLKIQGFDDAENSLSAMDRGNIIHQLMELFWQDIRTQAQLNRLNEQQLTELLNKHCKTLYQKNINQFSERKIAYSLELQRAQEAALLFLNIEKQREPFEVIAFEKAQEQIIKGLHLSLRVDRVDRLEDNTEIIIDYKSSPSHPNKWQSPRIDEPQLPIYLMNNPNAEAIAFGILNKNTKELGYKGIASRTHNNIGIIDCQDEKKNKNFSNQWQEIRLAWKHDIELHADNFMQGINFVDPKNTNTSCSYCEFSPVCRIKEIAIQENDDEMEFFE